MARLTAADLAEFRRQLVDEGDGEWYDPTVAQAAMPLLLAEIEALWADRDRARLEALREAATLLNDRLDDLRRRGPSGAPGYGCAHCHDAEAREFVTTLRARVGG